MFRESLIDTSRIWHWVFHLECWKLLSESEICVSLGLFRVAMKLKEKDYDIDCQPKAIRMSEWKVRYARTIQKRTVFAKKIPVRSKNSSTQLSHNDNFLASNRPKYLIATISRCLAILVFQQSAQSISPPQYTRYVWVALRSHDCISCPFSIEQILHRCNWTASSVDKCLSNVTHFRFSKSTFAPICSGDQCFRAVWLVHLAQPPDWGCLCRSKLVSIVPSTIRFALYKSFVAAIEPPHRSTNADQMSRFLGF